MAIFAKTVFRVLAIKWARRGVKAIVGCLNYSRNIIKTMVNIRIDFGRIFFDFFPYKQTPLNQKKTEPNVMEFFLRENGSEKKISPKSTTK